MKIVIFLYQGVTMLDAIGPYEVLRNVQGAEITFVAEQKGEIVADSGVAFMNVKHSIEETKTADILIIPGSTIAFLREMKNNNVLEWIKAMDQQTTWTASVCSGSLILASAGLLSGLKATSHWKPIQLLSQYGASPIFERIVEQEKYITAAGVSAGIDMALYLAQQVAGEEEAKAIQLIIEYDPQPPFQSGNYVQTEEQIIELADKKLAKDAKKSLGIMGLLKHAKDIYQIMKQ